VRENIWQEGENLLCQLPAAKGLRRLMMAGDYRRIRAGGQAGEGG